MKAKTIYCIGLLLLVIRCIADASGDVANAIRYTPPPNFYGGVSVQAPSNSSRKPFSRSGAPLLHYAYIRGPKEEWSDIRFQLGDAMGYFGPGKTPTIMPMEASHLKQFLESEYNGRFPQITPATIGKLGGLTAVSLVASRPNGKAHTTQFYFCYVRVETNILLKISASLGNASLLQAFTNSLQTVTINKKGLRDLLNPPKRE
ncbi:MAG: hypothetical protein ACLQU4_14870 [Limisphaerales bacterium]